MDSKSMIYIDFGNFTDMSYLVWYDTYIRSILYIRLTSKSSRHQSISKNYYNMVTDSKYIIRIMNYVTMILSFTQIRKQNLKIQKSKYKQK